MLSNIILAFFSEHYSEVKAWSIIWVFLLLEFSWKEKKNYYLFRESERIFQEKRMNT